MNFHGDVCLPKDINKRQVGRKCVYVIHQCLRMFFQSNLIIRDAVEEILHHLGWLKPKQYAVINQISTGAGFRWPIHRVTTDGTRLG